MSELRICKDCKYVVPDRFFFFPTYTYAKCAHPSARKNDPVTGKVTMFYCSVEREFGCGLAALNFAEKSA
jgi:hypothetical protein